MIDRMILYAFCGLSAVTDRLSRFVSSMTDAEQCALSSLTPRSRQTSVLRTELFRILDSVSAIVCADERFLYT